MEARYKNLIVAGVIVAGLLGAVTLGAGFILFSMGGYSTQELQTIRISEIETVKLLRQHNSRNVIYAIYYKDEVVERQIGRIRYVKVTPYLQFAGSELAVIAPGAQTMNVDRSFKTSEGRTILLIVKDK